MADDPGFRSFLLGGGDVTQQEVDSVREVVEPFLKALMDFDDVMRGNLMRSALASFGLIYSNFEEAISHIALMAIEDARQGHEIAQRKPS